MWELMTLRIFHQGVSRLEGAHAAQDAVHVGTGYFQLGAFVAHSPLAPCKPARRRDQVVASAQCSHVPLVRDSCITIPQTLRPRREHFWTLILPAISDGPNMGPLVALEPPDIIMSRNIDTVPEEQNVQTHCVAEDPLLIAQL